jgi:hypothetical protein
LHQLADLDRELGRQRLMRSRRGRPPSLASRSPPRGRSVDAANGCEKSRAISMAKAGLA